MTNITKEEFANIFDEMHILGAWDHVMIDDIGKRLYNHIVLRTTDIFKEIDNDHTEKLQKVVNALEQRHKKELQEQYKKKIEGYELAYSTLIRNISDLKDEIDMECIETERLRSLLKEKCSPSTTQSLDIPLHLGDIESIKF